MKGKSASLIQRAIKIKETRRAKALAKEAEEKQVESIKLDKNAEIMEAAKFLEEAGLIKLDVKEKPKTTSTEKKTEVKEDKTESEKNEENPADKNKDEDKK